MDEPFSAIDYRTKDKVINHFLQCLAQFSSRAVMITHDLVEAASMASCVLVIVSKDKINMVEFDTVDNFEDAHPKDEIERKVLLIKEHSNEFYA
jgi:NitT/TauT family transport system ATP-binding protein